LVSQRTDRLDQLLREEISAILAREVADPRIGFVTLTQVDVAPDLSHATVWVSVIGDEATRRSSLRALASAMPFVRRRLGELRLKRIPELHVRPDDSVERGTRVLSILRELEEGSDAGAYETPLSETLPTPAPVRGQPEPPVAHPQRRPHDRPTSDHRRHGDPRRARHAPRRHR
jgi:ribosome-binding factor A